MPNKRYVEAIAVGAVRVDLHDVEALVSPWQYLDGLSDDDSRIMCDNALELIEG